MDKLDIAIPREAIHAMVQEEAAYYLFFKRFVDIIGAIVGLTVMMPIGIVLAILIKIEDGGSIFFAQERIGKHGRAFKIYKFRSMCMDAEDRLTELKAQNEKETMFKMKNDPRVTNVGAFIRKHSLDEWPQFFNILRGDMSLVGPRPALPCEYDDYSNHDKLRLLVTPGLSGLWQVSGRSHLSYRQMIDLDIKYIMSRNLMKDFFILFLTVVLIFHSPKNSGAY
ncbi:MAG: sugar transferase [Lactobacillaceae bacterium]|jgi:lipopolysaccharide/colanic/teichoic acid biosynthesis glycosyltransferase|nr:sugar transferase [Lactobacillaceae bacterium]